MRGSYGRAGSTLGESLGNVILLILTVGVLLFVITSAAPAFLRGQSFVVLGKGMEPSIPLGSLVITEAVSPGQLQVGEVITYVMRSGEVVTHRIVEVVQDDHGVAFRTLRDSGEAIGAELVRPSNILGRVGYSIPLVGYLVHLGSQTATQVAVVAFVFLASAWLYLKRR